MTHTIVEGFRIYDQLYTNEAEAHAVNDGKEVVTPVIAIVHNDDVSSVINLELAYICHTMEEAKEELSYY